MINAEELWTVSTWQDQNGPFMNEAYHCSTWPDTIWPSGSPQFTRGPFRLQIYSTGAIINIEQPPRWVKRIINARIQWLEMTGSTHHASGQISARPGRTSTKAEECHLLGKISQKKLKRNKILKFPIRIRQKRRKNPWKIFNFCKISKKFHVKYWSFFLWNIEWNLDWKRLHVKFWSFFLWNSQWNFG